MRMGVKILSAFSLFCGCPSDLTRAAQLTIEMTFLEKESGATRWDLGFF
jgi:hypothetical protein